MSSTAQLPATGAPWQEWHLVGQGLAVPAGVHHPSPFSAELATTVASSPAEFDGKVVIDAGAGAGLITIAALVAGADHVIATDLDLNALAATRDNVRSILGDEAVSRISLLVSDFRMLHLLNADVLVTNPPQRPTALLEGTDAADRAVHDGAGPTGLGLIELLLDHACTAEVITTTAGLLDITSLRIHDRWNEPELLASAHVPMDPVWRTLGDDDRVNVWKYARTGQ